MTGHGPGWERFHLDKLLRNVSLPAALTWTILMKKTSSQTVMATLGWGRTLYHVPHRQEQSPYGRTSSVPENTCLPSIDRRASKGKKTRRLHSVHSVSLSKHKIREREPGDRQVTRESQLSAESRWMKTPGGRIWGSPSKQQLYRRPVGGNEMVHMAAVDNQWQGYCVFWQVWNLGTHQSVLRICYGVWGTAAHPMGFSRYKGATKTTWNSTAQARGKANVSVPLVIWAGLCLSIH